MLTYEREPRTKFFVIVQEDHKRQTFNTAAVRGQKHFPVSLLVSKFLQLSIVHVSIPSRQLTYENSAPVDEIKHRKNKTRKETAKYIKVEVGEICIER